MFKRFSMKVKIIVAIVVCAIGVSIVTYEGIQNRKNEVKISENKNFNSASIKAQDTIDTVKENIEKEKQKQEEEEKAKQDKLKDLEDKFQKGYDLFNNKKYLEAAAAEDEVIKEDSTFYKAYNVKGIALCYAGKYEEGMNCIDKALELKSDFGYARFNKALALELYGYYDEALQWYDKALEIEDFQWSYYGKASIYGRRGDVENTIKYLKQAIDVEPKVKEAARDEADFNPVRDSKEFQYLIK